MTGGDLVADGMVGPKTIAALEGSALATKPEDKPEPKKKATSKKAKASRS